jgi:hypothetical protein
MFFNDLLACHTIFKDLALVGYSVASTSVVRTAVKLVSLMAGS